MMFIRINYNKKMNFVNTMIIVAMLLVCILGGTAADQVDEENALKMKKAAVKISAIHSTAYATSPACDALLAGGYSTIFVGDGYCDAYPYNSIECDYDGGDCCASTCNDGDIYTCGVNGYNCHEDWAAPSVEPTLSPSAVPTIAPSAAPTLSPTVTDPPSVAPSTLTPSAVPTVSPSAVPSTATPTRVPLNTSCLALLALQTGSNQNYVGDGYCDPWPYNSAECDWDRGDCCALECTDGTYTCGVNGYNGCHLDTAEPSETPSAVPTSSPVPSAVPTFAPSAVPTKGPTAIPSRQPTTSVPSLAPVSAAPTTEQCTGQGIVPSYIGDGYCDPAPYNTEACGFDGGDCCEEECVSTATYTCGVNGYTNCHLLWPDPTESPTVIPTQPSAVPTAMPTTETPSAIPTTRMPSNTPVPTQLVTLSTAAPIIDNINVAVTSSSITLVLTFKKAASYSGTAYCAASVTPYVHSPSTPNDVASLVVANGYTQTFNTGESTTTVEIGSLQAVTQYYTYCYITNVAGGESDAAAVMASHSLVSTVSTECCRAVVFTNSPRRLHANLEWYTNAPSSQYTFTYSIPAPPAESITITPVFLDSSGNPVSSDILKALPTSQTFVKVSSASAVTGYFVVSGDAMLSGSYTLSLQISGASAADYIGSESPVTILSADAIPEAPMLFQSLFSNGGNYLLIEFDSSTNQAGISESNWDCSILFDFPGVESSTCSWSSNSLAQAVLSSSSTVNVADEVHLVVSEDNLLYPYCDEVSGTLDCSLLNASETGSVVVRSALAPARPTVVLKVPRVVNTCEDFVVDATMSTGTGGRPWLTAQWTVTTDSPDLSIATGVANVLNGYGSDINSFLRVPIELIQPGLEYSLTLSVTNFLLQSAAATVVFTTTDDVNYPDLNILGSSSVSVKPNQELVISAAATLSSCATTRSLTYTWTVTKDGVELPLVSQSKAPATFLLRAYSLSAGAVYTVKASVAAGSGSSATASATVSVTSGNVLAQVSGGYNRLVYAPVNSSFELDASGSTDENAAVSSDYQLSYAWSCTYASFDDLYGASCSSGVLDAASRNTAVLSVYSANVDAGAIYAYEVTVTAPDGLRSDSKRVVVEISSQSTPQLDITSQKTKVNADTILSLNGVVQAEYAVSAYWSARVNGQTLNVAPLALTPISDNFEADEAASQISFPLAIGAFSFVPGSVVAFRLNAAGLNGAGGSSFAEALVTVNSPPTGGVLLPSPTNGSALVTPFSLLTLYWSDDPEDLPFTFEFWYQVNDVPSFMSRGYSNSLSAALPAGLEDSNQEVTVTTWCYDALFAGASSSVGITVWKDESVNIGDYLSANLDLAVSGGYYDLLFQAVNNVGNAFITTTNCSAVPAVTCVALNRKACYDTAQTCSECREGYVGVPGSFNSMCFTSLSDAKFAGESCSSDTECFYNQCSSATSTCVDPVKKCSSADSALTCSGNGQCTHQDFSGRELRSTQCLASNPNCLAVCACDEDFGGADCSLNATQVLQRDAARTDMCASILVISNFSDTSSALLNSMINTLLVSYAGSEIVTDRGKTTCSNALLFLADMAAEGYLRGVGANTLRNLVQTVSSFVVPANTTAFKEKLARQSTVGTIKDKLHNIFDQFTSNFSTNYIDPAATAATSAVEKITQGILGNMANGQSSTDISTDNIRISVKKNRISNLFDTVMSPPQTAEEAQSGTGAGSSISFVGDSITECDSGDGYVQLGLTQFGVNPLPDADKIESNLLQFAVNVDPSSAARRRRRRRRSLKTISYDDDALVGTDPKFFITQKFGQPQHFNFSLDPFDPASNVTFPECSVFDGSKYVPCSGCVVSTYTNDNVTWSCYDMSLLCGNSRRRLPTASGDDDGAATNAGQQMSTAQIGAIFAAVEQSLAAVLSQNPFAINPRQAAPILVFVGALFFVIFGGFFYFLKWDRQDHHYTVYAKHEEDRQKLELRKQAMAEFRKRPKNRKKEKVSKAEAFRSALSSVSIKLSTLGKSKKDKEGEAEIGSSKGGLLLLSRSQSDKGPRGGAGLARHHPSGSLRNNMRRTDSKINYSLAHDDENENENDDDIGFGLFSAIHNTESTSSGFSGSGLMMQKNPSAKGGSSGNSGKRSRKKKLSLMEQAEKEEERYISLMVNDFFHHVMPSDDTVMGQQLSEFKRFCNELFAEHDLVTMFSEPSMSNTRTLRWLNVCLQIMLALFLDTLFFGMFFPNQGTCEAFSSELDCLAPVNKATDDHLCQWEDDLDAENYGTCTIMAPPDTVFFTLMLGLLTVILIVPVLFVFDFMRIHICSKRPDFQGWGCAFFASLLGRSTRDSKRRRNDKGQESMLQELFRTMQKEREEDAALELAQKSGSSDSQMMMMHHGLSTQMMTQQQKVLRVAQEHDDFIARKVFDDYTTVSEEANLLLGEVKDFLDEHIRNTALPWHLAEDDSRAKAKAKAIQAFIGVYPNGQPVPLSLKDKLMYGTARKKLEAKLTRVRSQVEVIEEELKQMGEEVEAQNQDTALFQFFILEQFSPFKRYVLKYHFFSYPISTPAFINPFAWVLAWGAILGTLLFICYWTLMWGVFTGGEVFKSWGLNFTVAFCQEFFIIITLRIYVVYVMAMYSIRPQLNFIQLTLNKIAINCAQGNFVDNVKDIRVVQHLSPACRAARLNRTQTLASAKILRNIDDNDVEECRVNRNAKLGYFTLAIVAIPALLAIFNEILGEAAVQTIMPSILNFFILANYYLYTLSVQYLCAPYVLLVGGYVLKKYVYDPMVRRRKEKQIKAAAAEMKSMRNQRRTAKQVREDAAAAEEKEALLNGGDDIDGEWKVARRVIRHNRPSSVASFAVLHSVYALSKRAFKRGAQRVMNILVRKPMQHITGSAAKKERKKQDLAWNTMNLPHRLYPYTYNSVPQQEEADAKMKRLDVKDQHIQSLRPTDWVESWSKAEKRSVSYYLSSLFSAFLFAPEKVEDQEDDGISDTSSVYSGGERPKPPPVHAPLRSFEREHNALADKFRVQLEPTAFLRQALVRMIKTYKRPNDVDFIAGNDITLDNLHHTYDEDDEDAVALLRASPDESMLCEGNFLRVREVQAIMNDIFSIYMPFGERLSANEKLSIQKAASDWLESEGLSIPEAFTSVPAFVTFCESKFPEQPLLQQQQLQRRTKGTTTTTTAAANTSSGSINRELSSGRYASFSASSSSSSSRRNVSTPPAPAALSSREGSARYVSPSLTVTTYIDTTAAASLTPVSDPPPQQDSRHSPREQQPPPQQQPRSQYSRYSPYNQQQLHGLSADSYDSSFTSSQSSYRQPPPAAMLTSQSSRLSQPPTNIGWNNNNIGGSSSFRQTSQSSRTPNSGSGSGWVDSGVSSSYRQAAAQQSASARRGTPPTSAAGTNGTNAAAPYPSMQRGKSAYAVYNPYNNNNSPSSSSSYHF